jgi:hypothetical protein
MHIYHIESTTTTTTKAVRANRTFFFLVAILHEKRRSHAISRIVVVVVVEGCTLCAHYTLTICYTRMLSRRPKVDKGGTIGPGRPQSSNSYLFTSLDIV